MLPVHLTCIVHDPRLFWTAPNPPSLPLCSVERTPGLDVVVKELFCFKTLCHFCHLWDWQKQLIDGTASNEGGVCFASPSSTLTLAALQDKNANCCAV